MVTIRHGKVKVQTEPSLDDTLTVMKQADVVLLARARTLARTGEGARIRALAALSVQEIADSAGCAPSTLWRWERGERAPHGGAAVAWARLLVELQRSAKS